MFVLLTPGVFNSAYYDRAPHLVPIRHEIERVFAASWQRFYGRDVAPAPAGVLATLRNAADRERGVPC